MIKIEHVVLPSPEQMEFVIEGMRNPMNSWEKSDSRPCKEYYSCRECPWDGAGDCRNIDSIKGYSLGPNDQELMVKLAAAGTDHRKFMRMMPVMVRITAPLYWWKEFDTYKIGTVANSCSTMHKITEKEFTLEDFSLEDVNDISGEYPEQTIAESLVNLCENYRKEFLRRNDKRFWKALIQILPSSYNQTRNVMLNYEVLFNIYKSRVGHKLNEWVEFCNWIETLPYHELITGGNLNGEN